MLSRLRTSLEMTQHVDCVLKLSSLVVVGVMDGNEKENHQRHTHHCCWVDRVVPDASQFAFVAAASTMAETMRTSSSKQR
jgi:hypothetical protein